MLIFIQGWHRQYGLQKRFSCAQHRVSTDRLFQHRSRWWPTDHRYKRMSIETMSRPGQVIPYQSNYHFSHPRAMAPSFQTGIHN